MVQHIDKDFLTDQEQYRHAEQYWEELWRRLVSRAGVTEKWQHPWLGAPLGDGNPMFSAVSAELHRGVHVIQHAPTSEDVELVWWLDRFGEEGIDEMVDQLVVSCALSREAAEQAEELMWSWITRGKVEAAVQEAG
jgi:hypothetical protein